MKWCAKLEFRVPKVMGFVMPDPVTGAVTTASDEQVTAIFAELDDDGSGEIEIKEFLDLINNVHPACCSNTPLSLLSLLPLLPPCGLSMTCRRLGMLSVYRCIIPVWGGDVVLSC